MLLEYYNELEQNMTVVKTLLLLVLGASLLPLLPDSLISIPDQLALIINAAAILCILAVFMIVHRNPSEPPIEITNMDASSIQLQGDMTLHSIADAVISTDLNGCIWYMNPVAERLTDLNIQSVRSRPVNHVIPIENARGETHLIPFEKVVESGEMLAADTDLVLLSGDKRLSINYSLSPIRDNSDAIIGCALVFQDVSRLRKLTQLLAYQATHDEVTGLINRREFERNLKQLIDGNDKEHVLCFMEVDQLALVSDTCGHAAAGRLVKQVASLVKTKIREGDILACLDGGCYALLLYDCRVDYARKLTTGFIELTHDYRFREGNKIFEPSLSIGLVSLSSRTTDRVEAINHADLACHIARDKGGNQVYVFHESDDVSQKRQGELDWAKLITQAYSEKRFLLYAQQIAPVNTDGKKPSHYEILLRMVDDDNNIVTPSKYIHAAERYNLMADLDRWVLMTAFPMISESLTDKPAVQKDQDRAVFAINLSGQSIGDVRMREFTEALLAKYPLLASCLVFEITETAAIANLSEAVTFIETFRRAGVRFSLDDFGSGLSSFSYLKNLNVDYLKIDGEFIRNMACDPVDYALVSSMNYIGHVMGLQTIAECVENEDIHNRLVELGINYGQGNWLAEPVPLETILSVEDIDAQATRSTSSLT
ncbi:MAG TPA: EAL domain-containing protein [Gammaproteobacteria bacterium]|nr:EAL domain-containing protein [Gammaproteobacteria bacterium]